MGFVIRKKTSAEPTTSYGLRKQAPGVGTTGPSQTRQPAQAGPWITVRKREGPSTLNQFARGAGAGTQALRFAQDPSLGGGIGLLGTVAPWLTSDPKKLQAIWAGTKAYGIGKAVAKQVGADPVAGLAGMTKMAPGAAPFLAEATGGTGLLYEMPQWTGGGGGVSTVGDSAPTIKVPAKTSWGQKAGTALNAAMKAYAAYSIATGEGDTGDKMLAAGALIPGPIGWVSAGMGLMRWGAHKFIGSSPNKLKGGGTIEISMDPELSSRFKLDGTWQYQQGHAHTSTWQKEYLDLFANLTRATLTPYAAIYNMLSPEQQAQITNMVGSFDISASAKGSSGEKLQQRLQNQVDQVSKAISTKLDPIFEQVLTPAQMADLNKRSQGQSIRIYQRTPGTGSDTLMQTGSDPSTPFDENIWSGLNTYETQEGIDWARLRSDRNYQLELLQNDSSWTPTEREEEHYTPGMLTLLQAGKIDEAQQMPDKKVTAYRQFDPDQKFTYTADEQIDRILNYYVTSVIAKARSAPGGTPLNISWRGISWPKESTQYGKPHITNAMVTDLDRERMTTIDKTYWGEDYDTHFGPGGW